MDIESELVRRAQEGDEEALGSIYRECFDGVYKYAYWNTGSREEAEDIARRPFTGSSSTSAATMRKRPPSAPG